VILEHKPIRGGLLFPLRHSQITILFCPSGLEMVLVAYNHPFDLHAELLIAWR
jgi:hypothetical protein